VNYNARDMNYVGGSEMAKADDARLVAHASAQLDRVLGFFPRVDSKISALFAVDTGMLALLAMNAQAADFGSWYIVALNAISVLLLGTSIVFLYRASFPQMKGGSGSLVYFREIGKLTEANYIGAMSAYDDERLARDLMGQVWRNSEILTEKFEALKHAFWAAGAALLPWLGALTAASLNHAALAIR